MTWRTRPLRLVAALALDAVYWPVSLACGAAFVSSLLLGAVAFGVAAAQEDLRR